MILGVGGKMGSTLATMARRAVEQGGFRRRVIGVARFSSPGLADRLRAHGVECVAADLLDEDQLARLPRAENVIYMVGTKFGTTGQEPLAWTINAYLPGRIADRLRDARIVVFSTGNVYPLVPVTSGGATEETAPDPVGEYAQSCLGRERVFEHFSRRWGTPLLLFRLNYAIDLRYGVLFDVARAVKTQQPIDLRMGNVNVIWQGDACEMALRALRHCGSPPVVLNVTGPETVSVRWLAERLGERLGVAPVYENREEPLALLSNASRAHQLFGDPKVSLRQMIEWTAHWVEIGGSSLGKPTHFQEREGRF